jgi:uroporphyrinogen decarboxylase
MTSRELVKAAIAHLPTPRVPYCIRVTGEFLKAIEPQLGQPLDDYLDNDVDCFSPPWWGWQDLGADWKGFDVPTTPPRVRGYGSYEKFADDLKRAKDKADKYALVLVYGSHFEKANFARGIEGFLADIGGAPEFARRLLTKIIEKNLVMLENFLARPEIDGVLLGSDWGSQRGLLMSLDAWDDLIRPGEQREYDLIHSYGKDVWVHSCGDVAALIPRLIEMGVNVLNPVQPECMDLAQLKRDFGDRLAFWGGISTQRTLPYGTPDEVRAEARRVRDLLARGGGYIFSPAQELQTDVPRANFEALVAVARE